VSSWLAAPSRKNPIDQPKVERPIPLDKHRLAVLLPTNISPDTRDEYLADGLTEELITRLSEGSGLKVIARTSIMNYKGSPIQCEVVFATNVLIIAFLTDFRDHRLLVQ